MMADVSLVREAIVVIFKETGGWFLLERVKIITKPVKMNLSPTPSETFFNELGFGTLLDPRQYVAGKVGLKEPVKLASKKKL